MHLTLLYLSATSSFRPEFEHNPALFHSIIQDQVVLSGAAGISFDVTNRMSLPEFRKVKEVFQEQTEKRESALASGVSGRARVF